VFPGVKYDMKVFKLPRTLRAKIAPHLPNILSDVTSIQDSNSVCKDETFRNAVIIQIYYNMENCGVLCEGLY
jgi:hypothetical protein